MGLIIAAMLTLQAAQAQANPDFNVTINTGPVAPNAATVYPGEATSLRITLSNNSRTSELNQVAFNFALPDSGTHALLVDGPASISGDAGCVGGALVAPVDGATVQLSGLTVPVAPANRASACYIDIPVRGISPSGASGSVSARVLAGEVSYDNGGGDSGSNATGGSQAITLRAVQPPQISKRLAPSNLLILGGTTRQLEVTVSNPDPNVALSNASFIDVFPAVGAAGAIMDFTTAAAGGSCVTAGASAVKTTSGGLPALQVSGLNLPAGGSCIVQVEVAGLHTDGGYEVSATNIIRRQDFTSREGVQPSADASARVRVRSPLAVQKSFSPSILANGTQGSFTVRLSNTGDAALLVNNFTDDPIGTPNPGALSIAGTADISNSCGGSASLENSGAGFSVGGFSIPAQGSCDIQVNFTGVINDSDSSVVYTNTIPAGAVELSGAPGIISQPRSATVIVADRLRALKSRSPANVTPGEAVRYDVMVQNYSDTQLNGVTLTDSLQNGSSLLLGGAYAPEITPACAPLGLGGAAQGDSQVTFTLGTLPARTGPGQPGSCVVSFWAMTDPLAESGTGNVIRPGDLCLADGVTCNQGASNTVSTGLTSPVRFEKTFDGQSSVTRVEGSAARMRLRLENFAPTTLSGIGFSDTLPSAGALQQLRIASPPNISNSCGGSVTAVAGSTSLALNGGSVAAVAGGLPGSCVVEVNVIGPAGVYDNTAEAVGTRTNADGSTTSIAGNGTLSDDARLIYNAALDVDKRFSPGRVGPDGKATVNIVFRNLDSSRPITGLSATDPLPAGMTVANPSNAYTTCAGAPVVSAASGSAEAGLSGGTLAPQASCALVFDVEVSGSSDWVNTIPAGNVTADGGIVNNSPVSDTLVYEAPEVPLVSKAINPGAIVPGESSTLTITITNSDQALTEVGLTDWFTDDGTVNTPDNGMYIANAPQASTSCAGGVISAVPGGNHVRLSGASLSSGESCEISVQVSTLSIGTITNRIPMNALASSQGATNSTTFAESTLSTASEFGIGKFFQPAVVSPSEVARLRIDFHNGDTSALVGFAVTDSFPAGLELAAEPNPITNCGGAAQISFPDNSSVRIEGGSIAAALDGQASSCFLEVDVLAADKGTYVNTIPGSTVTLNGRPVSHPPAEGTLQVRDRLIVTKAFDDFTLDVGDPHGFTTGTAARLPGVVLPLVIRLENPNDLALTEVTFTDVMPEGLVLAVEPNLATSCDLGVVRGASSGRELTLAGATLAATGEPGAVCTVTADVVSNSPGTYVNEIPEGNVTSYEGIDNNPGTQAEVVISKPPQIGKEFNPPVIAPDAVSQLTLFLGNDNEVAATLSEDLVDSLPTSPAPLALAAPANVATSCPGGAGIVSLSTTAQGSTLTVASGSEIPPGGCEVSVDVTASVPGDYLNYIPAGSMQTNLGPNETPAEAILKVSTLGYISGKVFLDPQVTPDGNYLPGMSVPIPSNPIELRQGSSCAGSLLDTVQTDARGNYLFAELPAGTYSVCQAIQPDATLNSVSVPGTIVPIAGSVGVPGVADNPSATTSQITAIELGDNGNPDEVSGSPGNNFSEVQPASIAGNVYFDASNDGVRDPGESGISGVTVELTGPVNRTTTTDANGAYRFDGLPPGEYTVTEIQPQGWDDGLDTRGTVDGAGRGDDSANDIIASIQLVPGDAGIEYNFGEIAPAVLAMRAAAVCSQDAVYADYTLQGFAGDGPRVSVRWLTPEGRVLEQLEDQPASGRLLWPGASVDAQGFGNGWPGWVLVDGDWTRVPDARIPELTFEVSFNPEARAALRYPMSTASCQTQPPGTVSYAIPVMPVWVLCLSVMTLLVSVWGHGRRHFHRGR